jgi:hypothetical protein
MSLLVAVVALTAITHLQLVDMVEVEEEDLHLVLQQHHMMV